MIDNKAMQLMSSRMGIFYPKNSNANQFYAKKQKPEEQPNTDILDPSIEGVQDQRTWLTANGGTRQQDRMILDKRRSLDRALLYSYQAANIKKLGKDKVTRALINSDKLKQDYDIKTFSSPFEDGYTAGDIFNWLGTNTYWIIYLQDLTETAYFRSEIRRCQYEIVWEDEDGNINSSYAAVRGPVETKINYIQKHGISVDTPNHSLNILMPRTKEALEYFRRYSKFYLKGEDEGSPDICWRVEATDWISTPGILEMTAVEYYINDTEDDLQNRVVGGLIEKNVDPNTDDTINGETFIKPKTVYEYTAEVLGDGEWIIDTKKYPVKYKIDSENPKKIKIYWNNNYSGQFEISFNGNTKTIIVESLF